MLMYVDISSKANLGDIFIRADAGQMCPKQDFIVVPPPSNIMEVKTKNYHRGQQRTLIKYKSKLNNDLLLNCIIYKIVALDSYL